MSPVSSSIDSLSNRTDEWISRQHTLLVVAQETQLQNVENDTDITDYSINSYVLYTPPMGRSNKLLPKHRGPYQVRGRKQSIYIIEDLVLGKQIKTHVHNLRPLSSVLMKSLSRTRYYSTSWRSSQKIQHGVPCSMTGYDASSNS